MLKIGLTGSFGTGKSSVASMFKRRGARVLDADKIAAQLIAPKGRCFKKVIKAFGPGIVESGKINKAALAKIVFNSASQRRKLERIIHPEVRREYQRQLALLRKSKKIVIFDVPLLFESGLNRLMNKTVVVKANQSLQVKRIERKRKLTKSQILKRIKAQWPIQKKIKKADFIIDNRKSLIQTQKQVNKIWEQLKSINLK